MRFYPYPLLDSCLQSLLGQWTLLPLLLLLQCSFRNPSWSVSSALRQPVLLAISRSKSKGYRSLPSVNHLLSCPTNSHQEMLSLRAPQTPCWPTSHLPPQPSCLCPFPSRQEYSPLQPEPHVHTHVSALTGMFPSLSSSSLLLLPLLVFSLSLTQTQKNKQNKTNIKTHHTHTSNPEFLEGRHSVFSSLILQVPAQFKSISN